MKYDNEIIESITREKASEKIRLETEADIRRKNIYSKLPRVAEIDSELSSTAFDIIRASFGKKENAADVLLSRRKKNEALLSERASLLEESGYTADATEIKYTCDICNDTGYDGGVLCRCMHRRYEAALAEKINSRLNLPELSFSDFSLDVYPEDASGSLSPRAQMREVLSFCRNFAESFPENAGSIYMSGGSGLGKSFLAACVARDVSKKGFSVVFDTAFDILGLLEDVKFGRSTENTDHLFTANLLILDDVGCEMPTPFTSAAFFNLINTRHKSGLSTIVISSLKASEMAARYGAQTLSRLEGDFIKLEFLGKDIRQMR
ncbi:MAG: ATP-binding protein [Oscillospiraceae bacterium]|nr:ATP-binding protein [Oscillospiraceae bacterium]